MKGITKEKMFWLMVTIMSLSFANTSFGQTNGILNLGILTTFEAYTGKGAVVNGTGSTWKGDAGTNQGAISGFGTGSRFTDNTYNADANTVQCRFDLLRLYTHLFDLYVDYPGTHSPGFGNTSGETITPGVYSTPGAGNIGGTLILDGRGDPDAFFVIKSNGALTVDAHAKILLAGSTQSCNVFFIANGAITLAANSSIIGTLFSKVGAVGLGANCILEGRMFSMEGAITTGAGSNVKPPVGTASIPIFAEDDCTPHSSVDVLGVISKYALYSSKGAVSNTATSGVSGHIASDDNNAAGYAESIVIGDIDNIAQNTKLTAQTDVNYAYSRLSQLTADYTNHSVTFGVIPTSTIPGEIIPPGVYDISSAGDLMGTLILDANNANDAVFVFRFGGALTVAAQTKMILINGASRCNVFFISGFGVPTGAISIGASATLKGTFLAHNGACGSGDNVFLAGRQLSTEGAVVTYRGIIYNNPESVKSRPVGGSALPIELLSFTGERNNQSIVLDWSTSSEINNDYFSIERSINAVNWNVVARADGAGYSSSLKNYSAIDLEPHDDISYYRLKQTDFNGAFKYSATIAIEKRGEDIGELAIYPNPASEILNLSYAGDKSQIISISIYNVLGENVYSSEEYKSKIVFDNKLNGIYFLHVNTTTKNVIKKFLVVD
jgi:hypothetical protein